MSEALLEEFSNSVRRDIVEEVLRRFSSEDVKVRRSVLTVFASIEPTSIETLIADCDGNVATAVDIVLENLPNRSRPKGQRSFSC